MVINCEQIHIKGISYKPHLKSLKDYNVVYYASSQHLMSAGQITCILLHTQLLTKGGSMQETFIAIQPLTLLNTEDQVLDFYRWYKLGGGFLCYDNFLNHMDIVQPSSIISHFTKTSVLIEQISKLCIHVLLLDRVSYNLNFSSSQTLIPQQLLKLAIPSPESELRDRARNEDQE